MIRGSPSLTNYKDSHVFLTGGENQSLDRKKKSDYLSSVEVYNIETDTWFPAPSLKRARFSHSSCSL